MVIEKNRLTRCGELKSPKFFTVRGLDLRNPLGDVISVDKHDEDPVHAIAMKPLGGRLRDDVRRRLNAKLVKLNKSPLVGLSARELRE